MAPPSAECTDVAAAMPTGPEALVFDSHECQFDIAPNRRFVIEPRDGKLPRKFVLRLFEHVSAAFNHKCFLDPALCPKENWARRRMPAGSGRSLVNPAAARSDN